MSSNLLDPVIPKLLIQSVKDVFTVQASTPPVLTHVTSTSAADSNPASVAAVIAMVGPEVEGTIALCFETETLLGVLNRMIGETYTVLSNENIDAAGELLNIVYASARVKMNEAGHQFQPAIPTVLHGEKLNVSHQNNSNIARAFFKTEFGTFYFEVSVRKRGKLAA